MNPSLIRQIRKRPPIGCCFALLLTLASTGCREATVAPIQKPVLELTVVCTDAAFAKQLEPSIQSWEIDRGNKVTVEVRPINALGAYDVAVLPAAELGQVAENGVATLPAQLRNSGDVVQWPRILRNYANDLSQWGDDLKALPVAGDGVVLVYRKDLFDEARANYRKSEHGELGPPASYEELAKIAAFFTKERNKPALIALPADNAELMSQFDRLAACYDRQARTDISADEKSDSTKRNINSIQFDRTDWQPRLQSPGFLEAARWFHDTAAYRPHDPLVNPVLGLIDGTAVIGLLKLDELSQLPLDEKGAIESRFALAPVPGTRYFYDADGVKQDFVGKPNYVPYLGTDAWVGVVAESSQHLDQAWELLGMIASRQSSIVRLSDPKAAAGPYRDEHIDQERLQIWLRYRFSKEQTKQLVDCMKKFQDTSILNPVMTLRTPNRKAVIAAAAPVVRNIATGKIEPAEGLERLSQAWHQAEESIDPETLKDWRRRAAGFR